MAQQQQGGGAFSGFTGAPVTRLITASVLFLSVICHHGGKSDLDLSYAGLSKGQLWRCLTGTLVFDTMPELFIGLVLFYQCAVLVERQMGLRKFGAYVCIVYVLNLVIQLALIISIAALWPHFTYIPKSGPYFLIFALLKYYHACVPKVRGSMFTIPVLNIQFSISFSKVWVYLLSLQLLFSSGFAFPTLLNSALVAAGGVLAGYLYDNSMGFQLNRYLLPFPGRGAV